MEQRFWIVNGRKQGTTDRMKISVHTWKMGEDLSAPIWQSRKVSFSGGNGVYMPEYPHCIIPVFIRGGDCHLGLNNGSVHSVMAADIPGHRRIVTCPSRFPDYNRFAEGRE